MLLFLAFLSFFSDVACCVPVLCGYSSVEYELMSDLTWMKNQLAFDFSATHGPAPHQVFVGDLPAYLTEDGLREYFSPFGTVLDCRVIRDPLTHKSKCFGFVRFARNEDAEDAISKTNQTIMDGRKIRTNWAIKREPDQLMSFEQVLVQASPYNSTIYIGGLGINFNAEFVRGMCAMYGPLMELRLFQDKGYAFVRYASRESAAGAILGINNSEINGHHVRCSWGKETRDPHILKLTRSLGAYLNTQGPAMLSPTSLCSPVCTVPFFPYPPPPHSATQIAANIGNYHISYPYASQFYPVAL